MESSRLIMFEGLPGTGKSTNSHFMLKQLELNKVPTKWIHEVARPHPILFFDEVSLTYNEYDTFIKTNPHTEQILKQIAIFRKNTVGIDLLEIEWYYIDTVGEAAFQFLKEFDVMKFSLDKYIDVAIEKWAFFIESILNENEVYILDSGIFQYQIFTFMLKNVPNSSLQSFIQKLIGIIKPLNPKLIYFYRNNVEDTISFLEKKRGISFLEAIGERNKSQPYYNDKPKGAEGHKCFLRDYANVAKKLFDMVDCLKLSIEITNQDWSVYENTVLSFCGIERKSYPNILPLNGIYKNEALNYEIEIKELTLIDPRGGKRVLIPKSDCEFYVECLPTVLSFNGLDKVTTSGGQICERWTTLGTTFVRV
jgi:hypothetical protein